MPINKDANSAARAGRYIFIIGSYYRLASRYYFLGSSIIKKILSFWEKFLHCIVYLKGHNNEADFLRFCRNRFGIGSLHYISSRSDLGFVFAEIFVR